MQSDDALIDDTDPDDLSEPSEEEGDLFWPALTSRADRFADELVDDSFLLPAD